MGGQERIRQEDKDRFVTSCQNWIKTLLDIFKERYSYPKELYERLPKIDLIYDAITQIQTTEHQFVCTSPDTKSIREKVTEAIDACTNQDEILLTGYFDNALVDRIIRALRRGVQVLLLFHHIDQMSATI